MSKKLLFCILVVGCIFMTGCFKKGQKDVVKDFDKKIEKPIDL